VRGTDEAIKMDDQPRAARLLVVDDSASIVRMTTSLLTSAGYDVDSAASGEAAFEKFLANSYDLVVSDITMGALSGVQLCRLIRNDPATADVPVVLLTGSDDPRSRFWARSAGVTAYVAKEAMRHTLVAEIARALDRNRATAPKAKGSPQTASSMERLCRVLDDVLFDAVIASEVRQLVSAADHGAFARAIADLAGDVSTYGYLLVSLEGPSSPKFVVHAREPWPTNDAVGLTVLGVPDGADVETIATGPTGPDVEVRPTDSASFAIQAGPEVLGKITAFSGTKPISPSDRLTFALLARELGMVAKTQFLMEKTKLLAETDALSGLYNRRRINSALELDIERARRHRHPLSFLIADIDHFKSVNDRFGHNVGDDVIRGVAATLRQNLRRIDIPGRWGGEEFVVLMNDTPLQGAELVAERIRAAIEALPAMEGGPERVTVSIGVATYADKDSPSDLIERADHALYCAKGGGRNRVESAPDRPATKTHTAEPAGSAADHR
jgi:two-component system, cell cycle response regulator